MAKRPRWTRRFLGEPDFDAISDAIKAAETRTSAEIRVHLERRLPRRFFGKPVDALERARRLFDERGRTSKTLWWLAAKGFDAATLEDLGGFADGA